MLTLKSKKLLVIAAHPDDEVYGCGGLINKIKTAGGKVFVLFLTNGTTKDFSPRGKSLETERAKEIENVAKFLKYDGYKIAFPGDDYHLKLDQIPQKDLIHEIERGERISLETLKPDIVSFHSQGDYNQDHAAVAKAAFAACRPALPKDKFGPQIVLTYEEPMDIWTSRRPNKLNFYVELSTHDVNNKLKALQLYKSQMKKRGHPRSLETIKSLAVVRGSTIGMPFAEGYFLHKLVT
ncbi:MAG: hypothetical protein A2Z11_04155 [Candidatus Woykebacteria bacterium RBG_16_43_9]|uniref:GlcNAc-PI de-N-acetylase n=1 Tax=Candidatus Woykebacteria bacterium RBG_16_43_9 TaxID=1802596 RepID=A0A1G1WDW6_9BACT|nr:MAG: hypothetical protein A2Z11_04155 [Candidatus Woykebacteria bacterium RBG_16_43_9]